MQAKNRSRAGLRDGGRHHEGMLRTSSASWSESFSAAWDLRLTAMSNWLEHSCKSRWQLLLILTPLTDETRCQSK